MSTDNYNSYFTSTTEDKKPNNVSTNTQSNVDTSPNNINNNNNYNKYFTSSEGYEPSNIEKIQYGAAQETYLLGDVFRLSKAAINSIGPDSFKESRQKIEDERVEELYKEFPWAKSGKYDNDAAVWGGRATVMITDPVYLLMPWSRAAQAGKLIGKGGASIAALGAGVGAGDAGIRTLARTGEFDPKAMMYGAALGGTLSPVALGVQQVGGKAIKKIFPNLFKGETAQANSILNKLDNNYGKKYDLTPTQLQNVKNISTMPKTQQLFDDVFKQDNNFRDFILPMEKVQAEISKIASKFPKGKPLRPDTLTNILKQIPGGLNIKFKSLGNKTILQATKSQRKSLHKEVGEEIGKLIDDAVNKQATASHNLQVHIIKELHKAGGLTSAVGRAIAINFTRPAVGAGGGAVAGTLFSNNDEGFYNFVLGGLALGTTHRVLMRGGIKGIPKPKQIGFAKVLKAEFWTNLDRQIRVLTSGTQQSKLTARGPITDRFSNLIFARPTDTVRLDWLGRVAKNQDDSIGLIGSGNSVEEVADRRFAAWVGSIYGDEGSRGIKGLVSGVDDSVQQDGLNIVRGDVASKYSVEAQDFAKQVRTWLDDFKKYYNDVGFTEKEILDNYFPRKFNYEYINSSQEVQDKFLSTVADIFENITRRATKTKKVKYFAVEDNKIVTKFATGKITRSQAEDAALSYFNKIKSGYEKPIIDFTDIELRKATSVTAKLPLSEHIEYERMLQGSWDDVEKLLTPYLVNDVGAVLTDVARTTVKSVEFARIFGKNGEVVQRFLNQLDDQYKNAGFNKPLKSSWYSKEHQADAQAIRDAVNSFFNRHGRIGTDVQRSIGAVLSTLANFNMMDKVTIANLGDLIQPFQNSRYLFSSIQGIGNKGFSRQMNLVAGKVAANASRQAYNSTSGSTPILTDSGIAGSVTSFLGKANEKFFKYIGLEAVTNLSRRYAYNVGVIDAHKTIKSLVNRLEKSGKTNILDLNDTASLKDIRHLLRTGTITAKNNVIANQDDIIKFGKFKNLDEAMEDSMGRNLIDRIGNKAANRDAIIPQVGNRLLFTQNRNPLIRVMGQFSSWAMAKSAQTNAMIQRVENAELRTAIGLLGSLVIFGGVKDLRDYLKTGEFNTAQELEDDPGRWFAEASIMSGNFGWLPNTVLNQVFGYGKDRPVMFFPAVSIAKDFADAVVSTGQVWTNQKNWDDAMKDWYEIMPLPTVREILTRAGVDGLTYKVDPNILKNPSRIPINKLNKGGVVEQTRMLFNKGDVVDKSFSDAFVEARNNRQELFEWQGNKYTTRKANETNQDYENFLGQKVSNTKVVLKEKPLPPQDDSKLKALEKNYIKDNIPLYKDGQKLEDIIIPKKKPILKVEKPNKSKFSFFSSAEAAIPDDKQEIEVNAKKFLEKDISIKDAVETEKFGFQKVVNLIPPNVRLVVNDVFTQSTGGKFDKVFTEKNLNKDYKSILTNIALDVLSQGKTNIEYKDYKSVDGDNAYADVSYTKKGIPDITDKRFNLKTALGQAQIKIDGDGNLIIVDRFNFNDSEDINSFTDFYQMVKEIGGSALQGEGYNLVRKVAKWFGSPEGEGQTVRINLGKVDLSNFKNVKIAKASKGGVIRKHFRYGGDTMGGPNDKSNAGQGSGSQGPAGGQSSGGNYGGGNNNNNNNNNDGSTARERYIANQYKNKTKTKTKTSNTGGGNGGSVSNNNNNNNNTSKNNKKNTKTFEYGDEGVTRGPFTKYEIDNPISTESLLNPSNIGAEVAVGYRLSKDVYGFDNKPIDNIYTGKAYFTGTGNIAGDTSKSFNIDFSNYKGYDATASYDLDNSVLSGNVTKYTDIGDSGYKVGVGVDYNDGDIGPSFQIKKSFKKGGLLDKKRG